MGDESYLQIGGLKRSDVPVENSRLRTTHNTWPEIDNISGIVNKDGGRRTGTVGIGYGRGRTEQHNLRPERTCLRHFARRLLRHSRRHRDHSRQEDDAGEFHSLLRFCSTVLLRNRIREVSPTTRESPARHPQNVSHGTKKTVSLRIADCRQTRSRDSTGRCAIYCGKLILARSSWKRGSE